MEFDENNVEVAVAGANVNNDNVEVANLGYVMATNSRLPSVVINNNHHFLGGDEQNIGVSR
jgi:hypothetical protein